MSLVNAVCWTLMCSPWEVATQHWAVSDVVESVSGKKFRGIDDR